MEIFVYILSLFGPILVGLIIDFFIGLFVKSSYTITLFMTIVAAKIVFLILWSALIVYKRDKPRALWRFTAEWALSGGYVAYAIFKYFSENGRLFHSSSYLPLPDSFLSKIWTYLNVHFAFAESGYGIIFPWIYVGLAVFLIGMCLFFIARNYIKTKELW